MGELIKIDPVRPDEVGVLLELITELAAYEELEDEVVASVAEIRELLFAEEPKVFAAFARIDGEVAGFCVYFFNFSTFLGRHGLYLEDLFVRKSERGRGVGIALMRWLASTALSRGCGRFEWSVLDWNEPAIDFYRSLGAEPMTGWTTWRLTGSALEKMGSEKSGMSGSGEA